MELNLNWFDYGFIALLLISTSYGFYRGFTREFFSLLTWVLAFWISKFSVVPVSGLFDQIIISPRLRLIVSFVGVLILTLFLFHFLTFLLEQSPFFPTLTNKSFSFISFNLCFFGEELIEYDCKLPFCDIIGFCFYNSC